jgi:GNAT superfamily N-acetyltransferase
MTTPRFSSGAAAEPIRAEQIEPAGRALARGFQDDPLAVYIIPEASERERLLPAHFTALIREGYRSGQVVTTSGIPEGAAVWYPPRDEDAGQQSGQQSGQQQADEPEDRTIGLPQAAFERLMIVVGAMEPIHHRAVPMGHYYLVLLGVDRDLHGQGVGGRLLQPMLARADAERQQCYLDTFNAANVPFYQRHGFEVFAEGIEPVSSVPIWAFRRNPR